VGDWGGTAYRFGFVYWPGPPPTAPEPVPVPPLPEPVPLLPEVPTPELPVEALPPKKAVPWNGCLGDGKSVQ
jgi:hypothetical protein